MTKYPMIVFCQLLNGRKVTGEVEINFSEDLQDWVDWAVAHKLDFLMFYYPEEGGDEYFIRTKDDFERVCALMDEYEIA